MLVSVTSFRRLFAGLLVVVLLAACAGDGGGAADGADGATTTADSASTDSSPPDTVVEPGPEAPEVYGIGSVAIGRRTTVVVDRDRVTPANGDQPELPERTLPIEIFYPAVGEPPEPTPGAEVFVPEATVDAEPAEGAFPLVVLSHGLNSRGSHAVLSASALASAGYVVVAPDHPLSNIDSPGGPAVIDLDGQAGDQSFLIDVFTDPDGPVPEIAGHVGGDRVAVGGHSLGGATSLNTGFAEGKTDDRVDAVFAWAGFMAPEPATDEATRSRPVLLIHGTEDTSLVHDFSVTAFEKLSGPRWFITLPGEPHSPPFIGPRDDDPASIIVGRATAAFLDAHLKDDAEGMARLEETVEEAGPDRAVLRTAD